MIEQKILNAQAFRQLRRIPRRRMMLLIGMEFFPVLIEAESLMEQPLAVFRILLFSLVVGLISAAGQLLPVVQLHAEAELLGLRGMNVEESHLTAVDLPGLPVLHGNELQAVADKLQRSGLEQHVGNFVQQPDHLFMTVDPHRAFILSCLHILTDDPNHPDHAGEMIDMLMRQKNLLHILPVKARVLQLMQNLSAAARVHHEIGFFSVFLLIRQHKAGVVALRHHRISGSQHGQLHLRFSSSFPFFQYIRSMSSARISFTC